MAVRANATQPINQSVNGKQFDTYMVSLFTSQTSQQCDSKGGQPGNIQS